MLFFTILLLMGISVTKARSPRDMEPHIKYWAWRLQHAQIINMTMEIVRDTTLKLNHAERIQDEHKHSIGYELGTIAAGILERFLYMLKLYRRFAVIKSLVDDTEYVESYMTALNSIQGAFHEIQLEKLMFFKILNAHKNVDPKKRIEDRLLKRMTMPNAATVNWFTQARRVAGGERPKPIWKPAYERIADFGFY